MRQTHVVSSDYIRDIWGIFPRDWPTREYQGNWRHEKQTNAMQKTFGSIYSSMWMKTPRGQIKDFVVSHDTDQLWIENKVWAENLTFFISISSQLLLASILIYTCWSFLRPVAPCSESILLRSGRSIIHPWESIEDRAAPSSDGFIDGFVSKFPTPQDVSRRLQVLESIAVQIERLRKKRKVIIYRPVCRMRRKIWHGNEPNLAADRAEG